MKKPTEYDNFNWVEARQNCSAAKAFEALKQTVEANVKEMQEHSGARVKSTFESKVKSEFRATMQSLSSYKCLVFRLRKDQNDIFVQEDEYKDKKTVTLTPFLNDDWECRFKVDGKGAFLGWQVARKFLEEELL